MSHHGNTPAAWTGVTVGMLAFLVGSIALMLTPVSYLLLIIGLVMLPLALIVFFVMTKMGMGESPRS